MGAFKDVLVMSFVWVSIINFVMVGAIAYSTTIRPSFPDSLAWISPGVFIGFMAVVFALIMFVEWKWIYPSYYAFRNKQEYAHQNLLRDHLDKQDREIKELHKKIDELLDALQKGEQ